MNGVPDERSGVLVVRLWHAPTQGGGFVGRVSSTADLAHTPRSETIVKGETHLRLVVDQWLQAVIAGAAAGPARPPED